MKKYKLIMTGEFEDNFKRFIPRNLKEQAEKKIKSLEVNPFRGKIVSYKFLRELKIDKFRIYYLIYKDIITILLVGVSDKKTQQTMIDKIKQERKELLLKIKNFKKYLK
ncbi:MAG: type II toxin-antitoxin system RelE/ParE family toxin [archaeon]